MKNLVARPFRTAFLLIAVFAFVILNYAANYTSDQTGQNTLSCNLGRAIQQQGAVGDDPFAVMTAGG
jgi:hypothetical protein